eukprot:15071-Heterococcus_DN1.PRE.1
MTSTASTTLTCSTWSLWQPRQTVVLLSTTAMWPKLSLHNVPVTSTPESIFPESFAALAASSKPEDIEQCAAVAPPLGTITRRDAAHIMSLAAKAHGGVIQRHCFASLAEAAAAANEAAHSKPPEQIEQSRIVPDIVGGDAAAAQAEHYDAVAAALKDTPYDLASITRGSLSDLKSAAARANDVRKHAAHRAAAIKPCANALLLVLVHYTTALQATVSYRDEYGEVPLATIVPVNKGTDRALARRAAFELVLPYVPSLDTVSCTQAERIHAAALAAAGAVEKGSYAELALAAAPGNDQRRPLQQQQLEQ